MEMQKQVADKVNKAYETEDKSKQLLEIAKTGVEKAIETDEATATAWIQQQLTALGVGLESFKTQHI